MAPVLLRLIAVNYPIHPSQSPKSQFLAVFSSSPSHCDLCTPTFPNRGHARKSRPFFRGFLTADVTSSNSISFPSLSPLCPCLQSFICCLRKSRNGILLSLFSCFRSLSCHSFYCLENDLQIQGQGRRRRADLRRSVGELGTHNRGLQSVFASRKAFAERCDIANSLIAAFVSALIVGVALHYHKIVENEFYGYPQEWFPSVSATIGDRYPERSFFMLFIAITSGVCAVYILS